MKYFKLLALIFSLMFIFSPTFSKNNKQKSEITTLTLGSWRIDDKKQMENLLKVFYKKHPDIKINFQPTNPPDYNITLLTKLEKGSAPDLFYLRSYHISKYLYDRGFLEDLSGISDLKSQFRSSAKSPWISDSGKFFAVPFFAVSHGIYYNKEIFKKYKISVPKTWEDFIKIAKKLKDAKVLPFANGSKDQWDINELVMMSILPNYIGGYKGRLEYESGKRSFNDQNIVAAFQAIKELSPYFHKKHKYIEYYMAMELFMRGKAAMIFDGSWNIKMYKTDFKWGVFAPPAPKSNNPHICFHIDAGIALNKKSKKKDAAKKFLEWLTTKEAGNIIGNEFVGFFPLHNYKFNFKNRHANQFFALNKNRGRDMRFVWPRLLDGDPSGYNLLQEGALGVLNGIMTPKQAADHLQNGLSKWYKKIKK